MATVMAMVTAMVMVMVTATVMAMVMVIIRMKTNQNLNRSSKGYLANPDYPLMRRKEREIKDIDGLELVIQKSDVCRIALFDKETPYIVTMNFGYIRANPSKIYFHCAHEGKKIDLIKSNNNACFQMDTDHQIITADKACHFGMGYKSVVGKGKIHIIKDEKEKLDGLKVIMKHYTGREDYIFDERTVKNTAVLMLEIDHLSGKMKEY